MPKTKKTTTELKTKAFAVKYIQNGMNATKTTKEVYNPKNEQTARAMGSEILARPNIQQAIKDELENSELNRGKRLELLKRNAAQRENYSASNQAIDIATKIAGDYAPERHESISLHLQGNDLQEAIYTTLREIEELNK